MATRTLGAANGVTVELDYDAVDNITDWRVVNENEQAARVTIRHIPSDRSRSVLVGGGTSRSGTIPTGAAQRIRQRLDGRGRWDDVEVEIVVPAFIPSEVPVERPPGTPPNVVI